MKTHYRGEIVTLRGTWLAGWAVCCSGDRAFKVREVGNHTYVRADVTCKACQRQLDAADLYERLRKGFVTPQSPDHE